MSTGIFAGVAVRDVKVSLDWYRRLLGHEPAFYPSQSEAVWQLSESCHLYIIEDADRAGGGVNMIWVDDPSSEAADIARRGLEPDDIEKHDPVWKYVFHDVDGNEIGVGGEVAALRGTRGEDR